MDTDALIQEIQQLTAELDAESIVAKPVVERAVVAKIRLLLEATRDQHDPSTRAAWEVHLPYAAALCARLSRLEPGWEEDLAYFASENAQFWVDAAGARLEAGEIAGAAAALGQVIDATRLVKGDFITQAELLLRALEIALEISERKRAVQLYEAAEKVYRKHLLGGEQYAGSMWTGRIKKIGKQLEQAQDKLRRYYQYSESISFAIEADSERALERVIEVLQERLGGRVKVTRRGKAEEGKKARASVRVEVE